MTSKSVTNADFKLRPRPTLTSHAMCTKACCIALHHNLACLHCVFSNALCTKPCYIALHHPHNSTPALQYMACTPILYTLQYKCPTSSSDTGAQHQPLPQSHCLDPPCWVATPSSEHFPQSIHVTGAEHTFVPFAHLTIQNRNTFPPFADHNFL